MSPDASLQRVAGRFVNRTDSRAGQPVESPIAQGSPRIGAWGGGNAHAKNTLDNVYDRQSVDLVLPGSQPGPTPQFLDHYQPSLSDLDLAIIATVARFGLMTTNHLAALFFPSPPFSQLTFNRATYARRVQKHLRRLVTLNLIGRLDRRVGGVRAGSSGYIYGLAAAGHRLLELPGRPRKLYEPLSPHIDHTLCVTDLYTRLTVAHRQGQLTVLDHKTEPECWTEAMGQWLKPDAYIRVQAADGRRYRWYLELDRGGPRGAQSERRIQAKLDQYRLFWERQLLDDPVFPRVLFVAVHDHRTVQLQATVDRQPEESRGLYAVATFADAVDFIARAGMPGADARVIDPLRAALDGLGALLASRAALGPV